MRTGQSLIATRSEWTRVRGLARTLSPRAFPGAPPARPSILIHEAATSTGNTCWRHPAWPGPHLRRAPKINRRDRSPSIQLLVTMFTPGQFVLAVLDAGGKFCGAHRCPAAARRGPSSSSTRCPNGTRSRCAGRATCGGSRSLSGAEHSGALWVLVLTYPTAIVPSANTPRRWVWPSGSCHHAPGQTPCRAHGLTARRGGPLSRRLLRDWRQRPQPARPVVGHHPPGTRMHHVERRTRVGARAVVTQVRTPHRIQDSGSRPTAGGHRSRRTSNGDPWSPCSRRLNSCSRR
jgi:hypothetical protein